MTLYSAVYDLPRHISLGIFAWRFSLSSEVSVTVIVVGTVVMTVTVIVIETVIVIVMETVTVI